MQTIFTMDIKQKNSLSEDNESKRVGVDGFEPPTLCL